MSVLPKDTIKVIAECVGISNLNDEIATQLASDVEYRIREIAQESIKFMKHAKREYLTTDDINNALKLRNIEVLYGYGASEPYKFSKVLSPSQAIYFVHDKELLFQDIIAQPLPKCPREPSLAAHWLALEGVQPLIPQNPPPQSMLDPFNNKKLKLDPSSQSSGGSGGVGSGSGGGVDSGASGNNNSNSNNNNNNNNSAAVVTPVSTSIEAVRRGTRQLEDRLFSTPTATVLYQLYIVASHTESHGSAVAHASHAYVQSDIGIGSFACRVLPAPDDAAHRYMSELNNHSNVDKQFEASKVFNSLTVAVGNYLSWLTEGENILTVLDLEKQKSPVSFDIDSVSANIQKIYPELFEIFGEKLSVYLKKSSDSMDTSSIDNNGMIL
ncbi:TATA-binding protein-associated-factor [Heterostelium album PN500]|uniref:TBP-associated factor 6 n=1 Tax=Heterostelium pallidum (strain ATCC 26659 / Pp 5 / PN500) TaxID=670386 RepID=D3BVI0_HETP5|nr:TATA-binding protein-associated-factor [Heterostelium album PN500]EFA74603.1 TATA-binding protein-associated-factor [Heterostelium album PN500]|eukprot:XP_020426737.1 TATA-binding protein-associated-factor [Heterostelium album PN500]